MIRMKHLNNLAWRHDPRGLALSFYKVAKSRTDLRTAEINKRWQGRRSLMVNGGNMVQNGFLIAGGLGWILVLQGVEPALEYLA